VDCRLAIDRLVALSKMARHREAIAWGRTIEAGGVKLPAYGQVALGSSLATQGKVGHALPCLERSVKESPFDVAAGMDLYYALLSRWPFRCIGSAPGGARQPASLLER